MPHRNRTGTKWDSATLIIVVDGKIKKYPYRELAGGRLSMKRVIAVIAFMLALLPANASAYTYIEYFAVGPGRYFQYDPVLRTFVSSDVTVNAYILFPVATGCAGPQTCEFDGFSIDGAYYPEDYVARIGLDFEGPLPAPPESNDDFIDGFAVAGFGNGDRIVGRLTELSVNVFFSEELLDGAVRLEFTPVPEPASWALMIGGFALAGAALRRRKTAVSFA